MLKKYLKTQEQHISLAMLLFIVTALFFGGTGAASAQTSCLKYLPGTGMPAGYGAPWGVFDPLNPMLVRTDCPSSGNTLTLSVGRNHPEQLIWSSSYYYVGGWQHITLSGSTSPSGWISDIGTATLTVPPNTSSNNPFFVVGYVCTLKNSTWKCGCRDQACTQRFWQLQAYIGNQSGGTTTGGTTGVVTGKKLKDITISDKAVCLFPSGGGNKFGVGGDFYGLRNVKNYLTPITYAPPGQMTTYAEGSRFLYDHSEAGIESGAQKLADRAVWGWTTAADRSKLIWLDFEHFDSVNVPPAVGYNRATDGELGALYDIHARQALRTESIRLRTRIVSRATQILNAEGYTGFEWVEYNAPRKFIYSDRNLTASNALIQNEVTDLAPYLPILSGTGPQTQLILGPSVLEGLADGSISWQSMIDWQVAMVRVRMQAHGNAVRAAPTIWPILFLSGSQPSAWPTADHLVPPGFMTDLFNALYDAGVRRFGFWDGFWDDATAAQKAAWDARWEELAPVIQQKCQRIAW